MTVLQTDPLPLGYHTEKKCMLTIYKSSGFVNRPQNLENFAGLVRVIKNQ